MICVIVHDRVRQIQDLAVQRKSGNARNRFSGNAGFQSGNARFRPGNASQTLLSVPSLPG
eukprot:396593-Pyramimonas_sp.AAC.1